LLEIDARNSKRLHKNLNEKEEIWKPSTPKQCAWTKLWNNVLKKHEKKIKQNIVLEKWKH
jgi:hypothetical protein